MSKPRCPYGMQFAVDFDSDDDCRKCMGKSKEAYAACQLTHGRAGALSGNNFFVIDGGSLLHFARVCLNIPFDTFVRVAYSGNADTAKGSKLAYFKSKYKVWESNPMKLICQLDYSHLNTLAAYIQVKLDEGDK